MLSIFSILYNTVQSGTKGTYLRVFVFLNMWKRKSYTKHTIFNPYPITIGIVTIQPSTFLKLCQILK